MNYIIALILPPVGVLFAGRFVAAVVVAVLWLIALSVALIIGHLLIVVLSWVIIGNAKAERRHRQLVDALEDRD